MLWTMLLLFPGATFLLVVDRSRGYCDRLPLTMPLDSNAIVVIPLTVGC